MVATVGNWVGEYTKTTGQGQIVFAGPLPGFTTFDSIAGDNVDFWYAIVDGDNREAGIGTYSGNFLDRHTIYSTLVNGQYYGGAANPLDLSGSAEVYSTFNKTAFDEFVAHIMDANIHYADAPANGLPYSRQDNTWVQATGGGGGAGGGSTEFEVSQPSHGFSVLDCITWDGTSFVYAQADDSETMALGVVVEILTPGIFKFSMTGRYEATHELTPDEWYYLSDTVPGGLTPTEPGLSQPIVYAQDDDHFMVYAYRPSEAFEVAVFEGPGKPGIVPDPITANGYVLDDSGNWIPGGGGGGVQPGDNVSVLVNDVPYLTTQFVPDTFTGAGSTGYVPDSLSETGRYLADDGTWMNPPVSPVGGVAMQYDFSTKITGAPVSGDIETNSADQTLGTEIRVSNITRTGNDLGFLWAEIQVGDGIAFWENAGNNESDYYVVVGNPVDNGGWWSIPVVFTYGTGGIENNRNVTAYVIPTPAAQVPLGGTAGQVLTKQSNVNYDDDWQDIPLNGVQSIIGGTDITVDSADPASPIVNYTGAGGISYWTPGIDPNDIVNTNSGKVGIGTDEPVQILDVIGNIRSANPNGLGNFLATRLEANPTNGIVLSRFTCQGSIDGINAVTTARIQVQTTEDWSATANGANMDFFTTSNATTNTLRRMRISSEGVVTGLWNTGSAVNADSQFQVVAALPGTPDPNVIYFVTG